LVDFAGFLSRIQSAAHSGAFRNEAEFRQEFLSKLAALLSENAWKDVEVRVEESLAEGRSDARVSHMVFEFKAPGELAVPRKRELFLVETETNLRKTADKLGVDATKFKGMLTDGRVAQLVAWHNPTGAYIAVDLNDAPAQDRLTFQPLVETAPWLEGAIHVLRMRELSPENLLDDFGPGRDLGMRLFAELWKTFQETKKDPRPESFFAQWKLLFSSSTRKVVSGEDLKDRIRSYGIEAAEVRTEEDVREFLFVLHTHYGLVLKFIALLVADTTQLLGPTSLLQRVKADPSVEWARAEEQLPRLAANVIERDVFSWFHLETRPELAGLVGLSAERFTHYDAQSVRRDVLKRVYQEFVPPKLRKALGEFYTPDWAGEMTLDEVGFTGEGRILDPSCGSGTFLALAIRRKLESRENTDPIAALADVLGTVVGFDLNPVAVSTARINYLLSIVDVLKRARPSRGVSIPVFLCDSVVVPSESVLDPDAPTAVVTTCLQDLVVPFDKKSPQRTIQMLRLLGQYADRSDEKFLESVRRELGVTYEGDYRPVLRELHQFIFKLQAANANGIWAGFIENFFAPLFTDKFDFVVGNPPWVAPVHVPKEYRDKVTKLTEASGYVQTYEPSLATSESRYRAAESAYLSCLPFVHVALERYLKDTDDARIGFLLTKSLVTALNAGGWRKQVLGRLRSVTDLSPITDIHEGANCWAFIPVFGHATTGNELPYRFCQRASPKLRHKRGETVPDLAVNSWELDKRSISLDPKDADSPWIIGPPEVVRLLRRMCKGNPRFGDILSLNMGIKTDDNPTFRISEVRRIHENLADILTEGGEAITVESELLFPLVTGELLSEWSYTPKWVLLPYDTRDWKALPEATVKSDFPEAYRYFTRHRKSLEGRAQYKQQKKGTPIWTIFQISPKKMRDPKVAFPLIELLLKAAPVPTTESTPPLAGSRPLVIDHSAYFVNTPRSVTSRYVSALLNSSLYRALAYTIAMPKGGFPYKQYVQWNVAVLPIIPMDKEPAQTKRIADEVEATQKRGGLGDVEFAVKLDELVGELFGFSANDTALVRRFLDFSLGKQALWSAS
jgi:methylase of polypeptide subunit release factors